MPPYADTSFLVAVYSLESDSAKALNWLQKASPHQDVSHFNA